MEPIQNEIKKKLLGCLEIALLMDVYQKRFGHSYKEALRSFVVPIATLPISFFLLCLSPEQNYESALILFILFSLRLVLGWGVLLGITYLIVREINRKKYFYQFISANNWVTLPVSLSFIPALWMLSTGTHSWDTVYPALIFLMTYAYVCTAFIAAKTLKVPWELASFIAVIAISVDQSTLNLITWIGG